MCCLFPGTYILQTQPENFKKLPMDTGQAEMSPALCLGISFSIFWWEWLIMLLIRAIMEEKYIIFMGGARILRHLPCL